MHNFTCVTKTRTEGTDLGKSIMDYGKGQKETERDNSDGDDYEKPAYPTIEKRRSFAYSDEQMCVWMILPDNIIFRWSAHFPSGLQASIFAEQNQKHRNGT